MVSSKKGISSHQLHRVLGIAVPSRMITFPLKARTFDALFQSVAQLANSSPQKSAKTSSRPPALLQIKSTKL